MIDAWRDFVRLEAAGGILLMGAAAVAMIVANSPLAPQYALLIDLPLEVRIGGFELAKPLLLWINDGLMAVFFLLVGLELKRELVEGALSERSQIALPALGAAGGMLLPTLIYVAVNRGDRAALEGWAIPAATDIAFALAVLSLFGSRVPAVMRVFLVSVAIFDDIGAVVIIALFYTSDLSWTALGLAALCLPFLFILNRRGVLEKAPYLVIGTVMWVALVKSGVHATLAGVVLALFIPIRNPAEEVSPLHDLEHDLHTVVAFLILPVFAFANAGVPLTGFSSEVLGHPVPLGILIGLFVGKQLGVFSFSWLGVRLGLASRPAGLTWPQLYSASILCGIGFTMSLFIGSLAFDRSGADLLFDERIGILAGSLMSGVLGYLVLRVALPSRGAPT